MEYEILLVQFIQWKHSGSFPKKHVFKYASI